MALTARRCVLPVSSSRAAVSCADSSPRPRLMSPNNSSDRLRRRPCAPTISSAAPRVRSLGDMQPVEKGVAVLAQSGALGIAVLDRARDMGLGVARFVSLGASPSLPSSASQWAQKGRTSAGGLLQRAGCRTEVIRARWLPRAGSGRQWRRRVVWRSAALTHGPSAPLRAPRREQG